VGLIKTGAGTLTLGSGTNSYSGDTTVNAGTLALGVGNAIPTNSNVFVEGAQFNIGNLSNFGAAIGGLGLYGGPFRVPTGNADYYLNSLNMTNGTVDFTGSGTGAGFWLHFVNANAGITINAGTSTWIGSGASRIQNDTANPLTITFNS